MKKRYDIIFSIGQDCACATYMKNNAQRLASSPFDWLTNANFETRMELILNDFKDFLNKEDLKKMERPPQFPADKNNNYYENIRTGFYFWHDFPANTDFEIAYKEVQEKYNRRIKRFLENLNSNKDILLIYLTHNEIKNDNNIKEYCNKINKKFGKNINFLIIEHNENMQIGKIQKIILGKNIDKYELYTIANINGIPQTQGQKKTINKIYNKYSLKNPYYKIKKITVKIICALIPNKNLRNKIRKITKED